MQEGEQAVASAAGGQEKVGWRADDEWMDEYRAADSRGTRDLYAPSARPGMAPEEEALIQVPPRVHINAGGILHVIWHEPVSRICLNQQKGFLLFLKKLPSQHCIYTVACIVPY